MMVAKVTAVYDGETVEEHSDINDADLDSLVQFGDQVIVHEVLDEDGFEMVRGRTRDDNWAEKVEFDDGEPTEEELPPNRENDEPEPLPVESETGDLDEPSTGVRGHCTMSGCDAHADVAVRKDTGEIKHYCTACKMTMDLGGHIVVEEESPLREPIADGDNKRHPREYADCAECGSGAETWEPKRQLPQVGQTYECSECGHEAHVYTTGDAKGHERTQVFRPVTDSMVTNLEFFSLAGEWPDSACQGLFAQGLARSEAIDYHAVEIEGLSQSEWARRRGASQQAVSENVRKAKDKLNN